MTFNKPKNVRYVEMAMYVDEKIKQDTVSEEESSLIYEYLYHLIYMLSVKSKFFNKEEYYDEFSLMLATDVFHRIFTNPKLNETKPDGTPKMKRIKSCLNYIKAILYGRKVAYEQKNYSQKYVELESVDISQADSINTITNLRDSLNFDTEINLNVYFDSISKTIKHYIQHNSPYRKNKMMVKNIYISCMLSILNSLTFSNNTKTELENKYSSPEAKFKYLCSEYKNNRDNCIILYHLPQKYKNYITVLVRQLYSLIGKDIQSICTQRISIPEDVLMNISLMEVTGKDYYDN